MPITACPGCGAQLKVPESASGRKAKCNKCQTTFVVPALTGFTAAPQPMPAHVPAPMAPPHAGQPMYAPPMPGAFQAPGQLPLPGAGPVAGGLPPGEVDDFDGRPRGRGRRGKKQKSSPVLLFVLIGVGAFLLIGGGVGAILWFTLGSGNAASTKYLPDNTDFVISMRVDQILASEGYKSVENQARDQITKSHLDFKNQLGIPLNEVSTVVVGGSIKSKKVVTVIRTKSAYAAADILSARSLSNVGSETVNGLTIYKPFPNEAFCEVQSSTFVFSDDVETLKTVLSRNDSPQFSQKMQDAIGRMNFSASISGAMLVPSDFPSLRNVGPLPEYAWFDVNLATDVQLTVNAEFGSADKADSIKKKLDEYVNMAKQMPGGGGSDVSLSQSGSQLILSATAKTDGLGPMMAMAGGGFRPPANFFGGGFNNGGGFNPPLNNGGGFNPPPLPAGGGNMSVVSWKIPTLNQGSNHLRTVALPAGQPVTIRVTTTLIDGIKSDVDLFVYESTNKLLVASDDFTNKDCIVTLIPQAGKSYQVEVRNLGPGRASCFVQVTR
jgi:hypothetical protein